LTEFKKPGIDLDLLCTRIDSSKKNIEDLSKKKIELELKISEISNKMELLEDKFGRSPKQELVDGLKLNRKEIVATNSRIDSLERVARELMGDVQNVEKNVRKFESIEKISSLSKNIEDKLERMQFIEEEVKRLTSKIELIYDEIDKKIGKIRLMEKDYSSDITTISETVETHKNQIQNISRLQIGELKNKFEALKSSLINVNDKIVFLESEQDDLNKKIGQKKESDNIIKSVEDIKLEILKEKEVIINLSKEIIKNKLEIEELHKETQNKMTPFIENASKRVESVEGMKLSLEKRIREMPNVLQAMVDLELSPMKNKSDYLERKVKEMKVDELKKILTDVTTEIAVINSKISSMELEQKSKIEEFGLSIKEKISEIRAPALLDDHIKELVNKIVFLESRIMGIEGMIQERSKNTQIMPIIIE
jgi:chromosome segregation ATPase